MRRIAALSISLTLLAGLACENEGARSAPQGSTSATLEDNPRIQTRSGRPNLILITLDTLRADALGIYGQLEKSSPRMDQLGREGVIFEHAMTTNPETLPSHASILTGQWPHHHGVRANAGFILPEAELTLAETRGAEKA